MRAFIAFLLLCVASPSFGQQVTKIPVVCGPLKALEQELSKDGQVMTGAVGIGPNGQLLVTIYASEGGARFTVVTVTTNGGSCILFRGTDWIPGTLPPAGEPA